MRKLTVLYLAANPRGTEHLRLDEEIRKIEDSLRGTQRGKDISLRSAWAVRVTDLASTIREVSPDIIHFSGHGEPDGIVLEDDDGQPTVVPGAALAELFRIHAKKVRCVVLNACFTESQAEAIKAQVPYVVGTWPQLSDRAAIAFAGRFYWALGEGASLAGSFAEGTNEIALMGGSPDVHREFVGSGGDPDKTVLLRPPSTMRRTALAAATLGVVALALYLIWPRDDGPIYQNTQFILDASQAMDEKLPDADGSDIQKMAVATRQITEDIKPRGADNLALRVVQGCTETGDLVVPFRKGATGAFDSAFMDITTTEDGFPLADAIIAATADFNDVERFPPDKTRRQIIVVTAGKGFCGDDPVAAIEKRAAELGEGIRITLDLIGLRVPETAKDELRAAAAAMEGGRSWFVEDGGELETLLGYLVDLEPVIEAADDIVAVGNDLVQPLNDFGAAMDDCDAATAQRVLPEVLALARNTGPALDDLATRDSGEGFIALHEAGLVWVEHLTAVSEADDDRLSLLDDVGDTLPESECEDLRRTDEWRDALDAHNERVREANNALRELEAARDTLVALVPDLPEA